jgi:transcriptional regulator with XRE-family HTH domain
MGVDVRPTVRRRVLGANLRKLREKQHMTLQDAAKHLDCDPAKISRIETARNGIRTGDLRSLLDLYGIRERDRQDNYVALAREGDKQRWWREFEDQFPQDFLDFLDLEDEVSDCRGFEPCLIHGLLQTRDYAAAVIRGGSTGPLDERDQVKLKVRMERQKVLTDPAAPMHLWMIFGEGALRHQYGGRGVLIEQLHHLVESANLPNVTLQVLPFSAGAYPAGPYSFAIYRFPQPSSVEVVHTEGAINHGYRETPEDTSVFSEIFDHLRAIALAPLESQTFLSQVAHELSR